MPTWPTWPQAMLCVLVWLACAAVAYLLLRRVLRRRTSGRWTRTMRRAALAFCIFFGPVGLFNEFVCAGASWLWSRLPPGDEEVDW